MTSTPFRIPAGGLVVAPRLPDRPKNHTGDPFTSDGDIVIDCDVVDEHGRRCGYHVCAPRPLAKKAYAAHHRLYHSESIGVVLLNQARQ